MTTTQHVPRSIGQRLARRWAEAEDRVRAYLVAAGLAAEDATATAAALRERVARSLPLERHPETDAAAARLLIEEARAILALVPVSAMSGPEERLTPEATPLSIRRQSLLPALRWRRGRWLPRPVLITRETGTGANRAGRSAAPAPAALDRIARLRRAVFVVLVLATTVWGVWTLAEILGGRGLNLFDLAHLAVFSLLMLWLSQSFWTLGAGFVVLLQRLARGTPASPPTMSLDQEGGRVAIVMPIYNEATDRVFAGLEAMWQDLRRAAPADRRIDLLVLSDTTDPDVWLAEIEAWRRLRRETGDIDRIFYRRRDHNVGRKTGNIEDFLTRFGASYAYMLVLDADSLMTGPAMVELVRRMDAHPEVGLIQAPPKLVRGRTLFARVLQLAGELYGPLSASGLAFWARGEGNYWGHNAIIRVRPFMELCGLPHLPGRAPLGGPILSHDFVEAALMRRGGWQVWIADDVQGSYEEPPPTIEDFAVRDRRWCQGNLQHIRVLWARHLHWVSRLHLAIGVMSYLTSPLWLVFLALSAIQAWTVTHTQPIYHVEGWPFPILPVSVASQATTLLAITLGLLFVPKFFGLVLALLDGERRRALGGGLRILAGALLETLFSALLAPLMMLLHTRFVASILLGAAIEWQPQRRAAAGGQLRAAARSFLWPSIIGGAAAIAAWHATPLLFWWLLPVTAGLVLAVPLVLAGASEPLGWRLARSRLLMVREEAHPPTVMTALEAPAGAGLASDLALARAVLEPQANALHLQLLRAFRTRPALEGKARHRLGRKAVYLGPGALDAAERRAILEDPDLVERLHVEAWLHWPAEHPEIFAALGYGIGDSRPATEPSVAAKGVAVA